MSLPNSKVSQSVSQSVTRSPNELSWTAKKAPRWLSKFSISVLNEEEQLKKTPRMMYPIDKRFQYFWWYFESNMPCWTRTRTYFPAPTVNWLSSSHLFPLEALHCPGHDLHCSLKSEWFPLRSFPEADAPVILGVSVKNYVAHFVCKGARSTVQPLSLISFYCAASFFSFILADVN